VSALCYRQFLILQDLKKVNNFVHISNTIADYLFVYVKVITRKNACGVGHLKNPNHKNKEGILGLILQGW